MTAKKKPAASPIPTPVAVAFSSPLFVKKDETNVTDAHLPQLRPDTVSPATLSLELPMEITEQSIAALIQVLDNCLDWLHRYRAQYTDIRELGLAINHLMFCLQALDAYTLKRE